MGEGRPIRRQPPILQLSVVICTYNRHKLLREAIASIERQSCPGDSFELLIVDNSSDVRMQRSFMEGVDITCSHEYIVEPVAGLSRSRNIGVSAAAGNLVAFMDDDAQAPENWVVKIIEAFEGRSQVAIVGGPVQPIWPGTRPPWLHPWLEGYLTILDRGPVQRMLNEDEWLAGTNIAFRREILMKAGNFNEHLGRIGKLLLSNEELLVTQAIHSMGFSVLYDPEIVMHHRVHEERIDQGWMRRRVFWQAVSDLLAEGGARETPFRESVGKVLEYLSSLTPKTRNLHGLFVDTDDPDLFLKQTEALATLVRLLATDGQDWRSFLDIG